MKSFLLYLISATIFIQLAQGQVNFPFDPATKKIIYKATIHAGSISKKKLYSASLDWFVLHYNSNDAIIQSNDSLRGQFRFQGLFSDSFRLVEPEERYTILKAEVSYIVDLDVSAGKCEITISELHYKYYIPGSSYATPVPNGITVENAFENQFQKVSTKMDNQPRRKKSWMVFFERCDAHFKSIISSYKKHVGKGEDF